MPVVNLTEIIGGPPGTGFRRPDSPPLPDVLLSADEFLHLMGMLGAAANGHVHPEHEGAPIGKLDPDCAACMALYNIHLTVAAAARAASQREGGES